MKNKNALWGIFLIILGGIALADRLLNIHIFDMVNFWPLFVLLPGVMFELGYFTTGRNAGLLVPGGILTTIGMLFLFETFTGWRFAEFTWPIYPLSVAIGLFQLYLFGGRERPLLIPVFIIGGFSLISLASIILRGLYMWDVTGIFFPVILIILGVYLLFRNRQ